MSKLPKKLTYILTAFFLLVLFAVFSLIGQKIYSEWKIKSFQKQWEQTIVKQKEKSQSESLALSQQQLERQDETVITPSPPKRIASGSHILHVALVKPPNLASEQIMPLISILKSSSNLSLNHINAYLNQESAKYEVKGFNLEIKTHGLYNLSGLNKVGDINYFWGKDPFGVAKLKDAFEAVNKENKININEQDMTVFLYFDDSFQPTKESEERFYESKMFRSFADEAKATTYINVYNFEPSFADKVLEIIVHETLHLFGATDKYKETDYGCYEKGLGEPDKTPLFPQTTGDIMCGLIETGKGKFERGNLSNLVINRITAQEIGW